MSLKFVCDGCGAGASPPVDSIYPQQVQRREDLLRAIAHAFIELPPGWKWGGGANGRVYHACSPQCVEVIEARTAGRRI